MYIFIVVKIGSALACGALGGFLWHQWHGKVYTSGLQRIRQLKAQEREREMRKYKIWRHSDAVFLLASLCFAAGVYLVLTLTPIPAFPVFVGRPWLLLLGALALGTSSSLACVTLIFLSGWEKALMAKRKEE